MTSYAWPGNVRELRNAMERAITLCLDDVIRERDLPFEKMQATFTAPSGEAGPRGRAPRPTGPYASSAERDRVVAALEACAGNQSHAATMLGVSRRTLITWIEKFGIPRPRKRAR
jgi:two-component system response regulator AtoC